MEQSKIDRINELARKKKAEGLTPAQLENTVLVDPDGTKHKVEKKNKPS